MDIGSMGRRRIYTDEERRARAREAQERFELNHPGNHAKRSMAWAARNREAVRAYQRKTYIGYAKEPGYLERKREEYARRHQFRHGHINGKDI